MEKNIPLIILMMVLATQVSRLLPIFVFSRWGTSPPFEMWLRHVPIAILSALIVPDFFIQKLPHSVSLNLPYFFSGLIALIVGLRTKNLIATTAAGVISVALLRAFLN